MKLIGNIRLRNSSYTEPGASGLLVRDEDGLRKYIVTCSHVAIGGSSDNLGGEIDEDYEDRFVLATNYGVTVETGILRYAERTAFSDFALIEVRDHYLNQLDVDTIISGYASVDSINAGDDVQFYSSLSHELVSGTIESPQTSEVIHLEYHDGVVVELQNLITFGNNSGSGNWESISDPGDSGSVVLNANNEAIGILIGATDDFSVAMPIEYILTTTQTTII